MKVKLLVIFAGVVGIGILITWFVFNAVLEKPQVTDACTMEAKICPDGSAVGRIGPNCEFEKCPSLPLTDICTDEAKICPDGSAVGRTGPNCEFEKCP